MEITVPRYELTYAINRFLQFKASDGIFTSNSIAFTAVTDLRFRDDIRPNNTILLRIPP